MQQMQMDNVRPALPEFLPVASCRGSTGGQADTLPAVACKPGPCTPARAVFAMHPSQQHAYGMVLPSMTHLQSAHTLPVGRVPNDDGVVDAAGGQQSVVRGPGQVIHLQPADMLGSALTCCRARQGQRPGDVLADESINLAHVPMWVRKLA